MMVAKIARKVTCKGIELAVSEMLDWSFVFAYYGKRNKVLMVPKLKLYSA